MLLCMRHTDVSELVATSSLNTKRRGSWRLIKSSRTTFRGMRQGLNLEIKGVKQNLGGQIDNAMQSKIALKLEHSKSNHEHRPHSRTRNFHTNERPIGQVLLGERCSEGSTAGHYRSINNNAQFNWQEAKLLWRAGCGKSARPVRRGKGHRAAPPTLPAQKEG